MSSPSDPPKSTTQNTNPVFSQPISDYECTLSDSSCCREVSQLVNNVKSTASMPHHNLQMSDLYDDADAFFAEMDAIVYESQGRTYSSAIVPIMERCNLISGRGGAPINEGERLPSGVREKDDEEASTDDEWYINELKPVDDCQSTGSEKFIDAANCLKDYSDLDSDSDGYELCLRDERFNSDSDDEVNFDVPSYLRGKFFEYNKDGTVSLELGLMFYDKNHFLEALRDFAILNGFNMFRFKHARHRFTALCSNDKECPWRIHASLLPDGVTFKIKTMNSIHTCEKLVKNPNANAPWLCKKLLQDVRANPDISIRGMQKLVMERYGIDANYMQLYRARVRAREIIRGNYAESYARLPVYVDMIISSNPGSKAFISWKPPIAPAINPQFKRLFISFDAMGHGFLQGCRSLIGVDGCHLTGPLGGILLSAVAMDGNNELFPVAFAIVESENRDSWTYFFKCLRLAIGDEASSRSTFISDRQKGIDPALSDVLPHAGRRICCRHLFANMKAKYKLTNERLKQSFWTAVYAYTEFEFVQAMQAIRKMNPNLCHELMDIPLHLWARHKFDPTVKNDAMTSNFVEAFNSKLEKLRDKPILTMLEDLRRRFMTKIEKKRAKSNKWHGMFCPRPTKLVRDVQFSARNCFAMAAGSRVYEVQDGDIQYTVKIEDRSCECRKWDITGIPCKHAAASIREFRGSIESYMDPCYSIEKYRETYGKIIMPVPNQVMWPESDRPLLDPPPLKRLPGRPRKNMRREQDEAPKHKRSHTITCTTCGIIGHNKRSCQRASVKKTKARMVDEGSSKSRKKDRREE